MQVVSCDNLIVWLVVTKSLRYILYSGDQESAVYFVWSIDTAVYVSKANACAFIST